MSLFDFGCCNSLPYNSREPTIALRKEVESDDGMENLDQIDEETLPNLEKVDRYIVDREEPKIN